MFPKILTYTYIVAITDIMAAGAGGVEADLLSRLNHVSLWKIYGRYEFLKTHQ